MSHSHSFQQPLRIRNTNPILPLLDMDVYDPMLTHSDGRLTLLILAMVYSAIIGWYSAALNVMSILTEVQSTLVILVSGNFYGFLMGYIASKDRSV